MIYLLLKALHIIAVISWMAGLLYLPRIFVYHVEVEPGGEADQVFRVMEEKLLRIIMFPAMIVSWAAGLALAWQMFGPDLVNLSFWIVAKLILVIGMTGYHLVLSRWQKDFATGINRKTSRFYRIANEVPTLLMIFIVLVVIVKPF